MRMSTWDTLWGLSWAAVVGPALLLVGLLLVGVSEVGTPAVYPGVMLLAGIAGILVLVRRRPSSRQPETPAQDPPVESTGAVE